MCFPQTLNLAQLHDVRGALCLRGSVVGSGVLTLFPATGDTRLSVEKNGELTHRPAEVQTPEGSSGEGWGQASGCWDWELRTEQMVPL